MMTSFAFTSRRLSAAVRRLVVVLLVGTLSLEQVCAHPMPNSAVLLDIHTNGVALELQLPLSELELAFGHQVNQQSAGLVARLGPQLRAYLLQHVRPVSPDGRIWQVDVRSLAVQPVEQSPSGPYQELTAKLWLQPPTGETVRRFKLNYDVIVHQVANHTALVSIRQDWERGQYGGQPVQVGVIRLDVVNNTIPPLLIEQAGGSAWQGFRGMVVLGMQHIGEGTDHLLFLLVLLLPAPLRPSGKPVPHRRTGRRGWGGFGGVRYSLVRLLTIVTAFTLGHSLTLILGALNWVHLPGQPVEILIAISILVSAVHAIRPIFPGREAVVAAGFGLVHGLAFADTLANLHLDSARMALSILGFNGGIELMQLTVIALTVPWLIILSRRPLYGYIRITGAVVAGVAALAWMVERITGQTNFITLGLETSRAYLPWGIVGLAGLALVSWWKPKRSTRPLVKG